MTPYPSCRASLLFSATPLDGIDAAERVDRPLPKLDPETGTPLPLLPCPYLALAFDCSATNGLFLQGTEYTIVPGNGDVIVLMLARRRPELSHAAFADRWLNDHAPFGTRTGASGYRQFHVDKGGVFDGVGLVFFRDFDHAVSARAAPEIARDATRDEMAFIDHSRSMLAMFRFR